MPNAEKPSGRVLKNSKQAADQSLAIRDLQDRCTIGAGFYLHCGAGVVV